MNNCAFDNGNKCIALCKKQCVGCTFRKTEEEVQEGRRKAKERIKRLPLITRIYITRKYYSKGSVNGG